MQSNNYHCLQLLVVAKLLLQIALDPTVDGRFMQAIRVDPELREFLPRLREEEFNQLEKNILAEGCRTRAVLVWKEKGVLLDGHNLSYTVCQKHKLPFDVKAISLPSMEAAKLWMIRENLGRRNFTDEQKSYWRGKQYEMEKKEHGGDRKSKGNDCTLVDTSESVAKQHAVVGQRTVKNDAKFTRAVDAIGVAAGESAKQNILNGNSGMGREEVQKLAEIATAQPEAAKNVFSED